MLTTTRTAGAAAIQEMCHDAIFPSVFLLSLTSLAGRLHLHIVFLSLDGDPTQLVHTLHLVFPYIDAFSCFPLFKSADFSFSSK